MDMTTGMNVTAESISRPNYPGPTPEPTEWPAAEISGATGPVAMKVSSASEDPTSRILSGTCPKIPITLRMPPGDAGIPSA